MNLKQLQTAIAVYRATASEQEVSELSDMLSHESYTTDERLQEIETERLDAIEKAELRAWQESPEGKEEAEYFRNAITLWYRTEDNIVTVDYDRRRPNEWEICIEERLGFQMHKLIGTQVEAQSYVENIVGTGIAYSPNKNAGARSWRFRAFQLP